MSNNVAAVLHGVKDLRMDTIPVPTPGPYDVLIEMKAVSICHSDVSYVQNGRIGDFILTSPMIMGHESSGRVAAVGSEVKHLAAGVWTYFHTPLKSAGRPRRGCRNSLYCCRISNTDRYRRRFQQTLRLYIILVPVSGIVTNEHVCDPIATSLQ
eukprot:Opistho-2@53325